RFLTAGNFAQRPFLYIDGDESFTKKGIEEVIGAEKSMKRNSNDDFYQKFIAIEDYANFNSFLQNGFSVLYQSNEEEKGLVSWFVQDETDFQRILVIANESMPTEVVNKQIIEGKSVYNSEIIIPQGFNITKKLIFENNKLLEVNTFIEEKLCFNELKPAEFHIFILEKI
ncbi:MAG: hypothetical protein PHV68_07580, partial [Candidatus Gastranaerophilales bacterium]|nr:hypothetical protein [Candidatus Gastranaerophilales bacterium]